MPTLFISSSQKGSKKMAGLPRTEFAQALAAVAAERRLEPEIVLETIKAAILAAYRRDARERGEELEDREYEAEIDPESGEARIFTWEKGKKRAKKDVTPPGFGRIAAQTAKQVILQKIREAEKEEVLAEYQGRVGSLVSGMVLRFDGPAVRVDVGRAEGIMPPEERVPGERLILNQRAVFLLKEIREGPKGKEIILSRADPELVKKLFAREVPEIGAGSVEIKGIAREAGARTKIAVVSNQSGVDPVGSCVGQKGVRVQAVISELGGEKIDVVPWNDDPEQLIVASLSPAEGVSASLDKEKKQAQVRVPDDQLSLAIGKEGQNVRLASKLTGFKIDIEGAAEVVAEMEEKKEEKEEKEAEEKKQEKKTEKKEKKKSKKKSKAKKK